MDYALLQKLYNIKSFVGYTDEEIAELRAGFESIPHTLYEIWKKCGKTSELFDHSNDLWITLDFQRRYKWTKKTKGYFYILNENQGVYQVAIRRADMAEDDPPVYVVETDDDGTVNEIGRAENSLSAFMMGMLIYEAAISCFEFCAEDIIWYDDGDVEKIDGILNKYAEMWGELVLENAPLRAVVNGTVLSVSEDFYDFIIWNRLTDKPVKECRLIGDILGQITIGVGDWWYAARIEQFIRQGRIKVVEDSENKYARLIKNCDRGE